MAFSLLIDCINDTLETNCNRKGIVKIISNKYLYNRDLEWMGCSVHKESIKERFVKLTCKLQIFNWCRGINQVLGVTVQSKMKDGKMTIMQKLAYNKFVKTRKYKPKKCFLFYYVCYLYLDHKN